MLKLTQTYLTAALCMLFAVVFQPGAVAQHRDSDLLRSANWNIIGSLDFKMEATNDIYPVFSPELKAHANKTFELTGYLIPITQKLKQSKFLLSTLPINQCFYCGRNGIPSMILVEMASPIALTNKPIKLKGKLVLKNQSVQNSPPIVLEGSVVRE